MSGRPTPYHLPADCISDGLQKQAMNELRAETADDDTYLSLRVAELENALAALKVAAEAMYFAAVDFDLKDVVTLKALHAWRFANREASGSVTPRVLVLAAKAYEDYAP